MRALQVLLSLLCTPSSPLPHSPVGQREAPYVATGHLSNEKVVGLWSLLPKERHLNVYINYDYLNAHGKK